MCLHPRLIRDSVTHTRRVVSCKQCSECDKSYRDYWGTRGELLHMYSTAKGFEGYFVTLTVSDEYLFNVRPTSYLRRYFEFLRLRKHLASELRHYLVFPELSPVNRRIHFHLIIYLAPCINPLTLFQCWPYGWSRVEKLRSAGAARYASKYSLKNRYRWHNRRLRVLSSHVLSEFLAPHLLEMKARYLEGRPFRIKLLRSTLSVSPVPYFRGRTTIDEELTRVRSIVRNLPDSIVFKFRGTTYNLDHDAPTLPSAVLSDPEYRRVGRLIHLNQYRSRLYRTAEARLGFVSSMSHSQLHMCLDLENSMPFSGRPLSSRFQATFPADCALPSASDRFSHKLFNPDSLAFPFSRLTPLSEISVFLNS